MLWRMSAALPGRAVSTHTRFHQLLWPIGAWCFLSLLVVSPVWLLARACPVFLALLGPLRDGGAMLLFAAQRVVGRFAVEGCVAAWVAVGDRTWNCYKQTNYDTEARVRGLESIPATACSSAYSTIHSFSLLILLYSFYFLVCSPYLDSFFFSFLIQVF